MAKTNRAALSATGTENIVSKIHVLRGHKVILDFDIAALYEVQTKRLNEQVKRNKDRFPEDFMFRLTVREWQQVQSQIATASQSKRNVLITPYAFTEHGVTMLASVLKSERAVKMGIAVVRAFIELKKLVVDYSEITKQLAILNDRIGEHDVQLGAIYDALENLMDTKAEEIAKRVSWDERERIGFKK